MAIVTGASRGIGRAISTRLASDGCIVALIARDVDTLAEVQTEIEKAGGTASSHTCDLQDSATFVSTIESIVEQYVCVGLRWNNAGVF